MFARLLRRGRIAAGPALVALAATIGYMFVRVLKRSPRLGARQDTGALALNRSRATIDEIDAALVDLFNRRASEVSVIFEYKHRNGIERFDGARTNEILRRVRLCNNGPLRDDEVEEIFTGFLRFFTARFQGGPAVDRRSAADRGDHPSVAAGNPSTGG